MFSPGLAFKSISIIGGGALIPWIVNLVKDDSTPVLDWVSANTPILECKDSSRHYKIYLTVNGSNDHVESHSQNLISLKVLDAKNNNHVIWGPDVDGGGDRWTNWALRLEDNKKISLQFPSNGHKFDKSGYLTMTCIDGEKIEKESVGGGSETIVYAARQLENQEENLFSFKWDFCGGADKKSECDISLDPKSKLKWSSGFKPKIFLPKRI